MEFICSAHKLASALAIAERFTGKTVTLPILSNVCMEARGNVLRISATNLEHAVELRVGGNGKKDGRMTLPGKLLVSSVQSYHKEDQITLQEKQGGVVIEGGERRTHIKGLSADEFPLIPQIVETRKVAMESGLLKHGLEKVLPAVSLSEFKPVLAGVYVRILPGEIRCVATDSFRLAEWKMPHEQKSDQFSFILPQRISQELVRILPVDGEAVEIGIGENQARIAWGDVTVVTRLVDGQFPDYETIIPHQYAISGFLQREDMVSAVRAAGLFASRLQDVGLKLNDTTLKVTSANEETGTYHTLLPINARGGEIALTFNHRYLLDGLLLLDEPSVFIGINSEHAPVVLRNKSDEQTTYILTPLRLS